MKWIIYDLAFAAVFPFLLPGFLARMLRRGGYAARFADRFAIYPREILARFSREDGGSAPVWIHAVSVGEVQVALQLMREWRKVEPDVRFCFSTTSSTGWKIAHDGIGAADTLIYNPLDFPNFVKSALRTVRPRAIVLTESEIWPVFIRRAKKEGVPVFLINARVSDRSAPRYKLARWFFKDVFACFAKIFAQSALDAQRLGAAGAAPATIETTGSFKFDVAARNPAKERELREWIEKSARPGRILLGASTWPGEDAVLLDILKTLPQDVALAIAPRHFEKADAVEENIRRAGFACVRRSRGDIAAPGECGGRLPVFLADTTGELMGLYGIADAVFVGKSLCEHGSQNMIEPCLCGKPVAVGPYTENFRPVMSDLKDAGAIVQVADAAQLAGTLARWFSPDGAREAAELGERARRAVAARRGVVPKCTAAIREILAAQHAGGDGSAAALHGRKKRSRAVWLWLAAFAALFAAAFLHTREARRACTPYEETPDPAFRYKPLDTIAALIGKIEFPAAPTGAIAVIEHSEEIDWRKTLADTPDDAAIVLKIDMRKKSLAAFKEILDAFPCADAHLWMLAETDWVLSGRRNGASVALGDMLEVFADDSMIEALAEAECDTLPELFASYAGDRATCAGAFRGNMAVPALPEYLVPQEIPDVGWISPGDLDEDILEATAREMRSMMLVRHNVIEGSMLARKGKTDDAIEKWAAAILRNPHDTMLLARLHQLAVNAIALENVGNFAGAAKCYETMLCVRPRDIAAIAAYANCLRRLGKTAMADDVMRRVDTLESALDGAPPPPAAAR